MYPANSHLKRLHFDFVSLKKGQRLRYKLAKEEGLVSLLKGKVRFQMTGDSRNQRSGILGPRRDVFSEKSFSCYFGRDAVVDLMALNGSEFIFVKTKCLQKSLNFIISPKDVLAKKVGKGTYSRTVHHILREKDSANVLLAGETFNEPGKWSSYPPHKHDQNRYPKETKLEEVYFFKVKPENKFGLMRLYGKYRGKFHEKVIAVKNNDIVIIPFGYHPVSALPDTQLYYFWALAGNKRKLRFSPDPSFC